MSTQEQRWYELQDAEGNTIPTSMDPILSLEDLDIAIRENIGQAVYVAQPRTIFEQAPYDKLYNFVTKVIQECEDFLNNSRYLKNSINPHVERIEHRYLMLLWEIERTWSTKEVIS